MELSNVVNYIGAKVHLNGLCDLAFCTEFRPYLYPEPKIPFVFTIVNTRGGRVRIKCDSNNKFLTVNAINIDLIV